MEGWKQYNKVVDRLKVDVTQLKGRFKVLVSLQTKDEIHRFTFPVSLHSNSRPSNKRKLTQKESSKLQDEGEETEEEDDQHAPSVLEEDNESPTKKQRGNIQDQDRNETPEVSNEIEHVEEFFKEPEVRQDIDNYSSEVGEASKIVSPQTAEVSKSDGTRNFELDQLSDFSNHSLLEPESCSTSGANSPQFSFLNETDPNPVINETVSEEISPLSWKDNGIFALKNLSKNEFFEIPCKLVEKTEKISDYYFEYDNSRFAIPDKLTGKIRHSCEANAVIRIHNSKLGFELMQNINQGEEITVSYNWNYNLGPKSTKSLPTLCTCNSSHCNIFLEKDLSESLKEILSKLEPYSLFHRSNHSLEPSVLADVSSRSSKDIILKNVYSLIHHCKGQNSITSIFLSVLRDEYPYAKIYKYAKDPSFDETTKDARSLNNAQSWVSRKIPIGNVLRLFNEAIVGKKHNIQYCYTGSMKKAEQICRKVNDYLQIITENSEQYVTLLQKLNQMYKNVKK